MLEDDDLFRVPARLAPDALRALAGQAVMPAFAPAPRAADLVDIMQVDPAIALDIRYASSRNFLGFPVYPAGGRSFSARRHWPCRMRVALRAGMAMACWFMMHIGPGMSRRCSVLPCQRPAWSWVIRPRGRAITGAARLT